MYVLVHGGYHDQCTKSFLGNTGALKQCLYSNSYSNIRHHTYNTSQTLDWSMHLQYCMNDTYNYCSNFNFIVIFIHWKVIGFCSVNYYFCMLLVYWLKNLSKNKHRNVCIFVLLSHSNTWYDWSISQNLSVQIANCLQTVEVSIFNLAVQVKAIHNKTQTIGFCLDTGLLFTTLPGPED